MFDIEGFQDYLAEEELSEGTIATYVCGIKKYAKMFDEITKSNLIAFKKYLIQNFKPQTVNIRITAIIKCIQQLSGRYSPTSVFFDWVQCMALAISNSCHVIHGKTWQQREELYKATMSKYDESERSKLAEMCGMLVMALEEGLGDTLGEIYMGSIGGDAGKGQFFTPYHVSLACAKLTVPQVDSNDKIRINEPTCGSGGMVVAAAQVLKERGENYRRKLDVVCQDLDWTAVYMCYVQLSLLGICAIVAQGNTLSEPYVDGYSAERVFYTPAKMGLLL